MSAAVKYQLGGPRGIYPIESLMMIISMCGETL